MNHWRTRLPASSPWRAWLLAAVLLWAQTAGLLHGLSHTHGQLPGAVLAVGLADGSAPHPADDAGTADAACQLCLAFAGLLAAGLVAALPGLPRAPQSARGNSIRPLPRARHHAAPYGARAPPPDPLNLPHPGPGTFAPA